MAKMHSNSDSLSPLLKLLTLRSGNAASETPDVAMEGLIEKHRRKKCSIEAQIQYFLRDRRVASVELSQNLDCEGQLEPLGTTFAEGFVMRLNKNCSHTRQRFTLAHEACHTFFYELVPEIKFRPHCEDEGEERLCNLGAAALLIPASRLSRHARELPVCLDTLYSLAHIFDVSASTMFLRLRYLKLWNLELSIWDPTSSGKFIMRRLYGGRRVSWSWGDNEVLQKARDQKASMFGSTHLTYHDPAGTKRFRPGCYEIRKHGDGLIALWGEGLRKPKETDSKLLKRTPKPSSRRHPGASPMHEQTNPIAS